MFDDTSKRYSCLSTLGKSMLPFILPGSRLDVKPVKSKEICVGDVVCYPSASTQMVAHRVVGIHRQSEGARFEVRGDYQNSIDIIDEKAIAAVVTKVNHRWFSYSTNSLLGKWAKNLALQKGLPRLLLFALIRTMLATYHFTKPLR